MPLIFVYGTLKRGGSNHRQLDGQEFVGTAQTIAGYRLFDLGDYPGMVAASGDRPGVTGEVWSVDSDSLRRLDALEGVDQGLYQRVPVALQPPFGGRGVETYLYLQSVSGRTELGSSWPV